MTDANFQLARYAVLTEDDPNQKFTSTRKTYAPVADGSKTFPLSQLKRCTIYANLILIIFRGTPKTVITMTDSNSVTQFFSNQRDSFTNMECMCFCLAIQFFFWQTFLAN